MAGRIRTIKPELLDDEKASALPDSAWRLFVSSWLLADDHGNFRAGERYLASQVWQDTGRIAEALGGLRRLAADGFVQIYEVNGERYANLRNWPRHQRVDNAGKPRMPGPAEADQDLTDIFAENHREPRRLAARPRPPTPTTDPDPEGEGEGESEGEGEPAPRRPPKGGLSKKTKRRPKTPMPEDWTPTLRAREAARSRGLDPDAEAEKFRAWTAAGDYRYVDWNAAFRNHLLKAADRPGARQPAKVVLDAQSLDNDPLFGVLK